MIGIDLLAEAKSTAVATVEWRPDGSAAVTALRLGADDGYVLGALEGPDRAAVDCPLGWPDRFVDFLVAHRDGHVTAPVGGTGLAWRRTLSRRETDLECERVSGTRPLSVSADRIGAVAMHGAGLLGALAAAGRQVDRAGSGLLIETYLAAALRLWGLSHQGYKGSAKTAALGGLVDALLLEAPGLDLGASEGLCRASDDALDAVVCGLVARAAALGTVLRPGAGQEHAARRKGWIVPAVRAAVLVVRA